MAYNEKELMEKMAREKSATTLPPRKETIGEILAKAREAANRDIAYISGYLKIKPQYLKALEDNKFSNLPGQAYVVGFIKSYASYLGLDAGKLVEQYKAENAPRAQDTEPQAEGDDALIKNPLINSNHIIIFGLIFLVGVFVMYAISGGNEMTDTPTVRVAAMPDNVDIVLEHPLVPQVPQPLPQPEPEVEETIPYEVDHIPEVPVTTRTPAPTILAPLAVLPGMELHTATGEEQYAEPVAGEREPREFGRENRADSRILLEATDRVWVKLKKDGYYRYDETYGDVGTGETVFETILYAGDTYHVPDAPDLFLTIGNAQGIDIIADGERIRPLATRAVSRFNIEMDAGKLRAGTAYVHTRGR